MFPVALALGEGGETRAPMAVAVIGGLITSTMLTLVVVPVVYMIMSRLSSSRPVRWLGMRVTGAVPVAPDGGRVTIVHSNPPEARL
jgi:HAE1 family hydrophobic/amphiphilic exporter-1